VQPDCRRAPSALLSAAHLDLPIVVHVSNFESDRLARLQVDTGVRFHWFFKEGVVRVGEERRRKESIVERQFGTRKKRNREVRQKGAIAIVDGNSRNKANRPNLIEWLNEMPDSKLESEERFTI
jgi:hypothetical protein